MEKFAPIIVFWVVFACVIVFNTAKRRTKGQDRPSPTETVKTIKMAVKPRIVKQEKDAPECYSPIKDKSESIKREKAGFEHEMFEDRQHDWLAKQLREEYMISRRGDLLDLGARHGASCSAREVKNFHLSQHDDSIDNGEI